MKSILQKTILAFFFITASHIVMAQQFSPQQVLDDLTVEQIKEVNALGRISEKSVTSPIYDFKLSKILTPAQARKYNALKDGEKQSGSTNYPFNIDSK